MCSLEGPPRTFRDEETKSHFTNYSLSSSVLRRNELLSQLDGCFEEKVSGGSTAIQLLLGFLL